eukprot:TRINITY_DN12632_c0_g1_i1.p1 TRINITY_DN12632_c0_g1~~TRINITY_DN12632_c0_g1_i1.p1  ORF type:complete len:160 (-),score=24.08 TRINITY_DN12632_c0_g1_i1:51-530(-)
MYRPLLLLVIVLLDVQAQQQQPPITIQNESPLPIRICSIDANGALGPEWTVNTLYNLTVVPTNTVGKYHIVPSELFTCDVLYQPTPTYAVGAVGDVVGGRKVVSLLINQFKGIYPVKISSLSVWQNETLSLFCGDGNCGGSKGFVIGSVLAQPFNVLVQ